jgi:hypothetical protein
MSTDYDPVRRLAQLGLGVLAASVRDGTEVTIHLKGEGTYCVYRPKLCINVDERARLGRWTERLSPFRTEASMLHFRSLA